MGKRLMLAGLIASAVVMTACNKNTGTVKDAAGETSGENLVSTEIQETPGTDDKNTASAAAGETAPPE